MKWEEDNCDLSALRNALEAQASNLASIAARLRTAEDNIEQQQCANLGLKSALVKLASREAVTRSQLYAVLEKMETEVADIRAGRNSTSNSVDTKKNNQSLNKGFIACKDCESLSKRLEKVERRLEELTRGRQMQSAESRCQCVSSVRENSIDYFNEEHVCSVTTERALETTPKYDACKKSNYFKETGENLNAKAKDVEENEDRYSVAFILNKLETISSGQENISSDEFCGQLNFYLKRIYLATIGGRNVSAKLLLDLGRCFFRIENSKVFKKLENNKKNQLQLLLKDIIVHLDSVLSRMKKPRDELKGQERIPVQLNESIDHCSTSTFEALCHEKQNGHPLQQIFDDSDFTEFDERWNDTLHTTPYNKTATVSKNTTQSRNPFHYLEEKENVNSIALDDSTDLEWQECFRRMNENL